MNLEAIILVILASNISFAESEKAVIVDCKSSHNNLNVRFVAKENKAEVLIEDEMKRKYSCTYSASYRNQKDFIVPSYKIKLEYIGSCKPRLPVYLSKNIRDEISLKKDLINGELTLLWATFTKALPCIVKSDNLESYFSAMDSQPNRNQKNHRNDNSDNHSK
jgi:hypothetical protein